MKKTVYIQPAGCNRRQLDLEKIRTYLELNGYQLVDKPEQADRILVATCAFKKKEEDDSVQRLERLRPYADRTVVYGCLPDIAPARYAQLESLPKVAPYEIEAIETHFAAESLPFGTISEAHLLPRTQQLPGWNGVWRNLTAAEGASGLLSPDLWHQVIVTGGERVRALLRRQDPNYYLTICRGCVGKCSYCGIRRAIGTVKSKPAAGVVADLCRGLDENHRVFTVLGDDPGCYGLDLGSTLTELLEALSGAVEDWLENQQGGDPPVLHLREVHPKFLIAYRDELLAGNALNYVSSLLCPLQSGSDRILARMEREHTYADYRVAVAALQARRPDLQLTTQIIIGFPGEETTDFRMTLDALQQCGFASVVVFPYDRKEGTKAAAFTDEVPRHEIRRRMRETFRYCRTHGIKALYNCPP